MKKRIGCLFLLMVLLLSVGCTEKKHDGLTYVVLSDDTVGVSVGSEILLEEIKIPSSYQGKAVTQIRDSGFSNCPNLKKIKIPDSVTKIGSRAFSDCPNLTDLVIPDSVTWIGQSAFSGCGSLTEVKIPAYVYYIENGVFSNCPALETIKVAKGNEVYCAKDNCLIEKGSQTLIAGCKKSIIPLDGSVTSLANNAFKGCVGLKEVTIPDCVKIIGDSAFYGCNNLKGLTIPESIETIGDYSFSGCNNLISITIPSSAKSIGANAFSNCRCLIEVYDLSERVSFLQNGQGASDYIVSVRYAKDIYTSLDTPSKLSKENGSVLYQDMEMVRYIGDDSDVTIPEKAKYVDAYAFYGIGTIKSITYAGSIEQWKKFSYILVWEEGLDPITVHCSDGDVTIE